MGKSTLASNKSFAVLPHTKYAFMTPSNNLIISYLFPQVRFRLQIIVLMIVENNQASKIEMRKTKKS